jgi:hypothetical protein
MSRNASLRCLLVSTTVAVVGGAVGLGLLPASASTSAAPLSGSTAAAPAVAAPVAAPAVADAQPAATAALARTLPTDLPAEVADLLRDQAAAGLDCDVTANSVPLCLHGEDAEPAGDLEVASTGGSGTGTSGEIGCYGDGNSGPRVRAVYARPASAADRYSASVPSIRSWAAGMSSTVDASARATGGRRHVRFATSAGSSCAVTVLNVVLPDAAFGSFRATIDALEARGFNKPSSKYLVWADAAGLCGVGTMYADDRPGVDNLNNSSYPSYARVDRKCWGKVETHELVHMLGGIQRSAPNATAGMHCNDGHDVMCYDDRTAGSKQRSVCSTNRGQLLDCRNDDYFSASPAKGSYLQKHWNTARSSFLSPTLTEPAPASSPAPKSSSSPSPRPSSSPSSAPIQPLKVVESLPKVTVPAVVPPAAPAVAPVAPVAPAAAAVPTVAPKAPATAELLTSIG